MVARGRGYTVAAIAIALAMLGCGSVAFPDRQPVIEGEIVGVAPDVPFDGGSPTKIWVKEEQADPCGIVFETADAAIGRRGDDGAVDDRTFDDLAPGVRVRVWADAVAESCPGQADATAIEILT